MPTPKRRSTPTSTSVIASTGVASTRISAGRVDRPDEERQPEPGHAGRAQLVHRDDEVEPGEDRGEAGDEDAERRRPRHGRWRTSSRTACRTSSRYRRRRRAAAIRANRPPSDEEIPAQQIEAREGEVARADHQRQQKLPSVVGIDGNQEEPHHHHAVQRESAVVGLGAEQVACGVSRLSRISAAAAPPRKKKTVMPMR